MPGGDRTGPRGEGPRTGWGMGFCWPGSKEKEARSAEAPLQRVWRWGRGFGRGFGLGRGLGGGRGRGWRRWFGW
jgi:hypothetical protein